MMKKLTISPTAIIFWGAAMIFLPAPLPFLAAAAVAIHELGHIAATLKCGGEIRKIILRPLAAEIHLSGDLSYRGELIVAASGAAANLAAAAVSAAAARMCAGTPLCSALYSFTMLNIVPALLNMLPISSLDGGTVLRCILSARVSADAARRTLAVSTAAVLILMWLAAVYILLIFGGGGVIFALCGYIFWSVYLR